MNKWSVLSSRRGWWHPRCLLEAVPGSSSPTAGCCWGQHWLGQAGQPMPGCANPPAAHALSLTYPSPPVPPQAVFPQCFTPAWGLMSGSVPSLCIPAPWCRKKQVQQARGWASTQKLKHKPLVLLVLFLQNKLLSRFVPQPLLPRMPWDGMR